MLGQLISHYRIIAKLGEGGMGVVYRAEDLKLHREVALKFLAEDLTRDRLAVERFGREAQAAAAINHPNICTVYEVGEHDGAPFLAMELLEGRNLKRRIAEEPLLIESLLMWAIQVTDALQAAHAHGIIHRDIKPGNIFITERGEAKILDFGLAKLVHAKSIAAASDGGCGVAIADSSRSGSGMGTPGYMAPEQVHGDEIDTRADLFAVGIVLYEMSTGIAPFQGATPGARMAAILRVAPAPPSRWNPNIPPGLEGIIGKAIEKDRDIRYQHASEMCVDLKRLRRDIELGEARTTSHLHEFKNHQGFPWLQRAARLAAALQTHHLRRPALAIAGAFVSVAGLLAIWLMRPLPPPTVDNFTQLTHDGETKALIGTDGPRLYLNAGTFTSFGSEAVPASGGEPVRIPLPLKSMSVTDVSSDGASLLVKDFPGTGRAGLGTLWSYPVVGGTPRRLDNILANDAAWSPDGKMLVYCHGRDLFLANGDGTRSKQLASLAGFLLSARFSPAGDTIRFDVEDIERRARTLWEVSIDGTNLHPLLPGWHSHGDETGSWTRDGKYFLFAAKGQIWELPERTGFLRRGELKPVRLTSSLLNLSTPIQSKDGKKLFVVGRTQRGKLVRYEAKSGSFQLWEPGASLSAEYVAFSPDRNWIAYVKFPEGVLYRSKPDGSEPLALSDPERYAIMPRWSPDSKRIVFRSVSPGKLSKLYMVSPDGSVKEELMPADPLFKHDPNWSPDGNRIVFGVDLPSGSSEVRILDLLSHQVSTLEGSQGLAGPRWSPDGRYISATANNGIGISLFDFRSRQWSQLVQIPVAFPTFSWDGKFLYFLRVPDQAAILRINLDDRKTERIADLKDLPTTGYSGVWLGLAPDNSPLLLMENGTQDVYVLDWHDP